MSYEKFNNKWNTEKLMIKIVLNKTMYINKYTTLMKEQQVKKKIVELIDKSIQKFEKKSLKLVKK